MTKNNNVIIIPARGGTSNVARQNLRLVADKPLIYYVITWYMALPDRLDFFINR